MVFLPYSQLHDSLAHPRLRDLGLIDGMLRCEFDIVKHVVRAVAYGRPERHLLFRIDHVVGSVAQQELGVDVPSGPREDEGRAVFL